MYTVFIPGYFYELLLVLLHPLVSVVVVDLIKWKVFHPQHDQFVTAVVIFLHRHIVNVDDNLDKNRFFCS